MINLVALSSQSHRHLRISTHWSASDFAEVNAVSVIPKEFLRLVAHDPIFCVKSAETGQCGPAALLYFERRENLFRTGARWDATHVPSRGRT